MAVKPKISLITLGTRNLPSARAFYERLGWVCSNDHDDVAFFELDGVVLGLFGWDNPSKLSNPYTLSFVKFEI